MGCLIQTVGQHEAGPRNPSCFFSHGKMPFCFTLVPVYAPAGLARLSAIDRIPLLGEVGGEFMQEFLAGGRGRARRRARARLRECARASSHYDSQAQIRKQERDPTGGDSSAESFFFPPFSQGGFPSSKSALLVLLS